MQQTGSLMSNDTTNVSGISSKYNKLGQFIGKTQLNVILLHYMDVNQSKISTRCWQRVRLKKHSAMLTEKLFFRL